MIRTEGRDYVIYCDGCEESVEAVPLRKGWQEMVEVIKKDKDWVMDRSPGGDWSHYCPKCAKLEGIGND